MNRRIQSITAAALIELLEDLPGDALVAFATDYGDYCHTEQVHFLQGEVEEKSIERSAYSDSGWAVKEEEEEEELDAEERAEKERNPAPTIWIIN
jgi:hypothetical protein